MLLKLLGFPQYEEEEEDWKTDWRWILGVCHADDQYLKKIFFKNKQNNNNFVCVCFTDDTDYKYNASHAYESPLRNLIRRSDDDDDKGNGRNHGAI